MGGGFLFVQYFCDAGNYLLAREVFGGVADAWLAQRGAKDSLGNGLGTFTIKEKRAFILHFARFFVPLHPEIK
jgi:hypothetical protein